MVVLLTSSPTGSLDGRYCVDGLDTSNHFTEELAKRWAENSDILIVTADPENYEGNDSMLEYFKDVFMESGFSYGRFDLWDYRTEDVSWEALHSYDVIIFGGGHVPTQNRFLHELQLKEKIVGFEGIIIGISAGSMDCADTVYAQPEEDGESIDPDYERWLPGLALTQTMILPHYQQVKDRELDGRRLYEDITYEDSMDNTFLALVDGSYLLIDEDGDEYVFGEAYVIENGICEQIAASGDITPWGE